MAPPANRSFYAHRLSIARKLGFTFVRHHTNVPPIEYFDAACEAGMMVSAEFPLGYGGAAGSCPGAPPSTSPWLRLSRAAWMG